MEPRLDSLHLHGNVNCFAGYWNCHDRMPQNAVPIDTPERDPPVHRKGDNDRHLQRAHPTQKPDISKSLIMRLCSSCASITISNIYPGNKLYFDAESLAAKNTCNLCAFFQALYAEHIEKDFRHLANPPNTERRSTTPEHAIRVEIENIVFGANATKRPRCNVLVVETSITNTWYRNEMRRKLYFRNLRSVDECRLGRHSIIKLSTGDMTHAVLSTWADLALARSWIQECITNHHGCLPVVPAVVATTLHPSTRLIDVQLQRLVLLEEIIAVPIEYVALSYVWGEDYQLRTTSQNIQAFRKHLSSDVHATNRLPRTIRDAMSVTRALGCRFLWVDALCIVQDLPTDLSIQLAQMDRIYSLAVVTIVARGSTSSDSGLPGVSLPRNRIKGASVESIVNGGLSVGHWDLPSSIDEEYGEKYNELANRRSYMWRGWTFQEQILSTRTLEFNPKRLLFWCGRAAPSQEYGYPSTTSDLRNPHHFRHAVRKYQRAKAGPDLQPPKEPMTNDMLICRWNTIRENYSTRTFTCPADRRNAVLGTSSMLRDVIGDIDSGGHVRSRLHEELLWCLTMNPGWNPSQAPVVKISPDPAPEGVFPSWSWLSLWPVTWPTLSEPFPGVSLQVLEFEESFPLKIDGPMLELRLVDSTDRAPMKKLAYPDETLANIRLQLDRPIAAGAIVTCVPLARTIYDMWWEYAMLLLRLVGPHYNRVGVGCVPEHDSEIFMRRINSEEARRTIICY